MAGATENRTKAEAGRVTTVCLHCREEHRTSRRKHKNQRPGASSPGPVPSCSLSVPCSVSHCSPQPHSLCSGPHPPGCFSVPRTAGLDHWWGCHHLPSYRGFQDTGAEREWEQSAQIPHPHAVLPTYRMHQPTSSPLSLIMPFVGMQKLRLREMKGHVTVREEGGLRASLVLCAEPLPHWHGQHSETGAVLNPQLPFHGACLPSHPSKQVQVVLGTATQYLSDCKGLACSSPCTYKMPKSREWMRIKV